jgi:Na+/phosphate symporter
MRQGLARIGPVSATIKLLDLAGDMGLLLWGTDMVTRGVLYGYGRISGNGFCM